MRQAARTVLIGVAGAVIVLIGLVLSMLFAGVARAEVTDAPITTWPTTWRGTVWDGSLTKGCVAGWSRPDDRFADWQLSAAWVDASRLPATAPAAMASAVAAQNLAALAAMRTHPIERADVQPCLDKLTPKPLAWAVAPLASGKRPAYLLTATGTRGAQSGTVDVLTAGQPTRCNCLVRSAELTSSVYCAPATAASEPLRVTLCRDVR